MSWQSFSSQGDFFSAASLPNVDPYLAWAEATAFQHFTRDAVKPTLVPVIVELREGKTPSDLSSGLGRAGNVAAAYIGQTTRFCTANFSAAACRRFAQADNGLVKRFEFTMPVLPQRLAPVQQSLRVRGNGVLPLSTTSSLIAVIDDGCPFAHSNFRRGASSRLLSLWDQDAEPAFGVAPAEGRVPVGFDYGREVDRPMIEAIFAHAAIGSTIDEDDCYEVARYPQLRRRATHGAHVLDQFVGPRRLSDRIALTAGAFASWKRSGSDAASTLQASDDADVIFIQLPRDAWSDPSGNALAKCVIDGLRYVMNRAGGETTQIVVNISCAIYTGPHNGSSILEQALEDIAKTPGEGSARRAAVHVFMPTGNSFMSSWRAGAKLAPSATASVRLRIPPSSEAPTFVQVWCGTKSGTPTVTVRAPGPDGGGSKPIPPGSARNLVKNGAVVASAIHTRSRCRGNATDTSLKDLVSAYDDPSQSSLFLLAVDPTRTVERPGCSAPSGDWMIDVTAERETEVHVYVARNESEMGEPLRGRAARLVDSSYDAERFMEEKKDDETDMLATVEPSESGASIPIRRRGTISGAATGSGTHAIAGLCLRPDRRPVRYSSAGSPDPHAAAVCDESRSLPGIRGAGTRSGAVVRLQGTSFASPQRARAKADGVTSRTVPVPGIKPIPMDDPTRSGRWGVEDDFLP